MNDKKHILTTSSLLVAVTLLEPTLVSALEKNIQNRVATTQLDREKEYTIHPKVSLIDITNTAQDIVTQDAIRMQMIHLHIDTADKTVIYLLWALSTNERVLKVDHYLSNGNSLQSYYLLKNNSLVPITHTQWTKYLY